MDYLPLLIEIRMFTRTSRSILLPEKKDPIPRVTILEHVVHTVQ